MEKSILLLALVVMTMACTKTPVTPTLQPPPVIATKIDSSMAGAYSLVWTSPSSEQVAITLTLHYRSQKVVDMNDTTNKSTVYEIANNVGPTKPGQVHLSKSVTWKDNDDNPNQPYLEYWNGKILNGLPPAPGVTIKDKAFAGDTLMLVIGGTVSVKCKYVR